MTADPRRFPPVSLAHAAFACRCPRCGEGRLFTGLLAVSPACPSCGLDFSAEDAGDGPQVFVIFFLGFAHNLLYLLTHCFCTQVSKSVQEKSQLRC